MAHAARRPRAALPRRPLGMGNGLAHASGPYPALANEEELGSGCPPTSAGPGHGSVSASTSR
eukprot:1785430-Alexandrium_andersonii.AAC.1